MSRKIELSYDLLYKEFIINDKNGKTIAEETGYHYATIYKKLKSYDIRKEGKKLSHQLPRQEVISAYENGQSMVSIGSKHSVSESVIKDLLVDNNMYIRGVGYTSKTDQKILSVIDSEYKAYFLGFLLSDGSITNKTSSGNYQTISLEIHNRDRYILEMINKEVLKGSGKLECAKNRETSYLRVHGVQLVKEVSKYGLVPNKSKTLNSLTNLVSKELYSHFIRGLFDGDGTANSKGYIGFNAANKDFVACFRDFLVDELSIKKNGIYFGTVYFTTWGAKEDREKLFNYLYKDASIFLSRKYDKIKDKL